MQWQHLWPPARRRWHWRRGHWWRPAGEERLINARLNQLHQISFLRHLWILSWVPMRLQPLRPLTWGWWRLLPLSLRRLFGLGMLGVQRVVPWWKLLIKPEQAVGRVCWR